MGFGRGERMMMSGLVSLIRLASVKKWTGALQLILPILESLWPAIGRGASQGPRVLKCCKML